MKRLLDAPHRVLFFAAAVQILLVSVWWLLALATRATGAGSGLPADMEPVRVHAFLMIYGFFPLFIFGFLFTAGPRWLDRPAPTRDQYVPPSLLALAGAWLMLPAFHLGPGVAAAVLLIPIIAWSWILVRFVGLIAASRAADRTHAVVAALAVGSGIVGLLAARLWLLTGQAGWAELMQAVGLWGFLVPLFATVSHRMIPFFTSTAIPAVVPWRPGWTLALIVSASVAHGGLVAARLAQWTWLVDAPVAAVALFLAWRWGFARSFANRMLAMLHVGFAWFAASWLLHTLQSALLFFAGASALGLAPLHALSIGFLASLTLAMVSRVSCGHSGRRVAADRLTWNVFLLLQAAAVMRVAADVLTGAYASLLTAAALAWLACFAAWAWRYLPFYWSPRADGKPG